MHGLTNKAIECFVHDTYGVDTWLEIARRAALPEPSFEAMLTYDDDITEVGAYLQSVTELSDRVELTAALRADHNNIVETVQWSPRAALVSTTFPDVPGWPFPTSTSRCSSSRTAATRGCGCCIAAITSQDTGMS